jgi:hypothetical protein
MQHPIREVKQKLQFCELQNGFAFHEPGSS